MSANAYSVARQYQDWHHPEQHHLYEHDDHSHDQQRHLLSEKKCMDLLNQDPSTTELPPQCENMQYIKVVLEERRTKQQQQNGKKDRVLATTSAASATKDKK